MTTVYDIETIELQDGAKVEVRPLNIKGLRKFKAKMKEFYEIAGGDYEDESALEEADEKMTDLLLEATAICLAKSAPKYLDDADAREEAFDMDTVYYVIEKAGGIKLRDPEAEAAMRAAMMEQAKKAEPGKS